MDVLQCFQAYLMWTDEAVCQMGEIIVVIDQDPYLNYRPMALTGTIQFMKTMLIIWSLTVSPSSIRLIWIWTTFVFTSSRLLFQKSRPQQADYHQCGCFRQPSQPERAVSRHRQNSRTHMISIEATESKPQSTLLLTCKSLFFSAVSVWVNFTLTLQWLVDQLISWSKGN